MLKNNLAVLLAERNLKISDAFESTGISKTTLTAIAENSGKGVQFETVDKLCNFLNVGPDKFFIYAPYLTSFEFVGDTETLFNYHMKNGNRDYSYSVWVGFLNPEENRDIIEEEELTKDFTGINHLIAIDVNSEIPGNSFSSIYNMLPVQFQYSVKNELLNYIVRILNSCNLFEGSIAPSKEYAAKYIDSFKGQLKKESNKVVVAFKINGLYEYSNKKLLFKKGKYSFK